MVPLPIKKLGPWKYRDSKHPGMVILDYFTNYYTEADQKETVF
jgi:hypothetical protein